MHTKEEFLEIFDREIKRPGATDLRGWLLNSDFFEAPASTRFHGNVPGGLCDHSVNVYYELKRLLAAYPEIGKTCPDETVAVISLLHDLCKVNYYAIEMRNKKIDGKWESVPCYTVDEKFSYAGYHGPKSVFLAQHYIGLTPEEGVAIAGHMGNEHGDYAAYRSYEKMPLAWLLHVADEASTIFEVRSTSV